MTDGRIPGKWMSEPRFLTMHADTWAFFTKSIAWSAEAGTDGHVPRRALVYLHEARDPESAYAQLESLGLWARTRDGYQFKKWAVPAYQGGLGQSSAETVRTGKARNAEKQRRYRERVKTDGGGDSNPVTLLGDVGQDRKGQAGYGRSTNTPEKLEVLASPHMRVAGLVKVPSSDHEDENAPCCGAVHDPLGTCPNGWGAF